MNGSSTALHKARVREIAAVGCILLFAGIIRLPSLTQPLGPDQGIMSVIGAGILDGKLPYKDFWEMASPAIFFTYALIFKIFGTTMAAIPIADTLISLLTTFFVFLVGKSIWGKKAGYISALVFAFFSNGVRLGMHAAGDISFGTFWYIAQRETFMLPLIVASFYVVLASESNLQTFWRMVVSGFMGGLLFVYKFPSLLFFLIVVLYLNSRFLFSKERPRLTSLLKYNLSLSVGFLLALIPFIAYFSYNGIMNDMIDIIFKYVYSVYGQLHHDTMTTIQRGVRYTFFLAKENFILWIFFITSSVYVITNERTKENLLVVVWAVTSLLYVISHREFFGYHYLVVLPPFSLLTGYGIIRIFGPDFNLSNIFTKDIVKVSAVFLIFVNLVFFATLNYMHYTKFFYYVTGRISKESYYNHFTAYPRHDYSFPADYSVAQYISNNSKAEDMIFALGGIESVIYFLSQRECPSRFIFSWIIFSPYPHSLVEQAAMYRKEVLTDLKKKTPKFIVTVGSLESFRQFSKVYDFICKNYTLEKEFPDDRFVFVHKSYAESEPKNIALQN